MEANKSIIDNFKLLIKQIKFDLDNATDKKEKIKHSFRLKHIQDALFIIKEIPDKIKKGEQLKHIKGIGEGIIRRINEILKTGKLKEIKVSDKEKEYLKQIKELSNVFGIGRKKAYELITKYDIHTIDDLKHTKIKLPFNITVGLKYFDTYKQNIPRKEMIQHDKRLQEALKEIDPKLIGIICGSYRRKKITSNDIDLMIVHPKINKTDIKTFTKIIEGLKEKKIIIDSLTVNYKNKFMGFTQLKNKPVRRIDIRFIPYKSYYPALLYFTGSGEFNRKMRMVANSMDYTLNEYGLYDSDDKLIKITSEEDIFNKLGMEYLEPEQRN